MSYCRFHPTSDAKQHCDHCHADYCENCCDESDLQRDVHAELRCFVCQSGLTPLEISTSVQPFWRVLDDIYRYPLSTAPLIVISLAAFLTTTFSDYRFFLIMPTVAVVLYCFSCLRNTALGQKQAPDVEKSFEGSISLIFYVFIIMLLAGLVTSLAGSTLGVAFEILVGIICVAVLPAAVLVIVIDERLLPAVNPIRLMSIVSTMGVSYFVMLIFILIMLSSMGILSAVFELSDNSFFIFIQAAIGNYYSIVVFHIMGYLVYQNHYQLNFQTKTQKVKSLGRTRNKHLNAKIGVLIKSGQYVQATELCKQQVKTSEATLWQWTRCFKLMCVDDMDKSMQNFSSHYFSKLEAQQQYDTLADAYIRIKKRLPEFEIKDPKMQLTIAQGLLEIGRYKFVVVLLKDFIKTNREPGKIKQAIKMLGEAHNQIPGNKKSAAFYQAQYQRLGD